MKLIRLPFVKTKTTLDGFALPTLILTATILMIAGVSVLQTTVSISQSLRGQHWNRLAQEAADAGISYAASCVKSGAQTWGVLTPDKNCSGDGASSGNTTVAQNLTSTTEPKWKSTFSVSSPAHPGGNQNEPLQAISTGTVTLIDSGKTFTVKKTLVIGAASGQVALQLADIIDEYRTALYGYAVDHGAYPITSGQACLGQGYPDLDSNGSTGDCLSGTAVPSAVTRENATLTNNIKPYFSSDITTLPRPSDTIFTRTDGMKFVGASFRVDSSVKINNHYQNPKNWIVYYVGPSYTSCPTGPVFSPWPNATATPTTFTTNIDPNNASLGKQCWMPLPDPPGPAPVYPPVFNSISPNPITINRSASGVVTFSSTGGQAPLTYSVSSGDNTYIPSCTTGSYCYVYNSQQTQLMFYLIPSGSQMQIYNLAAPMGSYHIKVTVSDSRGKQGGMKILTVTVPN